jgi:hypothetical protein
MSDDHPPPLSHPSVRLAAFQANREPWLGLWRRTELENRVCWSWSTSDVPRPLLAAAAVLTTSPIEPQSRIRYAQTARWFGCRGLTRATSPCVVLNIEHQSALSWSKSSSVSLLVTTKTDLPRASTTIRSKALSYCPSLAWSGRGFWGLDGLRFHHRFCAATVTADVRLANKHSLTSAPPEPLWPLDPHKTGG